MNEDINQAGMKAAQDYARVKLPPAYIRTVELQAKIDAGLARRARAIMDEFRETQRVRRILRSMGRGQ